MPSNVVSYGRLHETAVLGLLRSWRASVRRKLVLHGLQAWDIRLPPGFRAPQHEHELPFFCILVDGELAYSGRNGTVEFRPLLNVFHPTGTVHSAVAGPRGARILTLETTPAWDSRSAGLLRLPRVPTRVPSEEGQGAARRLLRELHTPEPCSQLAIEGLALELFAALSRRSPTAFSDSRPGSGRTPLWVHLAAEQIRDGFHEPLTLQGVAAALGVPATSLSLEFRRHAGCSFGEALRRARVEFVQRELAGGDRSLADLALAAGFADQAHCTRVFKATTGWTPGKYRSAVRRGELAALTR